MAIFCSAFVALAFTKTGPDIAPAALISPRTLYTLGIITDGLIFNTFIIGINILIKASVKPSLSKILPTITLTIIATPTSLTKNTLTTIGNTCFVMLSNNSDKELGDTKRIINDKITRHNPTTSIVLHFFLETLLDSICIS